MADQEESPQLEAERMYAIVVAGAMDPRQHVPQWYRLLGVLDEEQADRCLASTILLPDFLHFDAGAFSIQCDPNKWQIATTLEMNRAKILDITCRAFKKLSELPIAAFGTNVNSHLSVTGNVREKLSRVLISAGLGFTDEGKPEAAIKFSNVSDARTLNIVVEPSVGGPDKVFVAYNVHRPIKTEKGGYFDLGEKIKEHYDSDSQEAIGFCNTVATQIQQLPEE